MNRLLEEIRRFLGATVVSAALSLGLPGLLHEVMAVPEQGAVAIGLITALVVNFILQRRYVFRSDGMASRELLLFVGFSVLWRSLEYLAFLAAFALGAHYLVSLGVILSISMLIKFALCKWVIFDNVILDPDTPPSPIRPDVIH